MNKQIVIFSGCLLKDNKVLMVLRDEEECPEAHMKWEFPGGKVDFNETPQEAIKREFEEETGTIIKVKKLLPYVLTAYWDYEWGKQQTLCLCFICEYVGKTEFKKDHHVAKIEWFSLADARKLPSLPGTDEIINLIEKII
jgi:8-oxo-dGTP diphosphatase